MTLAAAFPGGDLVRVSSGPIDKLLQPAASERNRANSITIRDAVVEIWLSPAAGVDHEIDDDESKTRASAPVLIVSWAAPARAADRNRPPRSGIR